MFSLQPGSFSQCREKGLQNSSGKQVTQASPFVPQKEAFLPGWQTLLVSQQPKGQVCALQIGVPWQAPLMLHVWPGRHTLQSMPSAPQAPTAVPGWQVPVGSQQPVQFWGPQLGMVRHWPLALQVWPVGQVPQLPPQPSGPHARSSQSGLQVQR